MNRLILASATIMIVATQIAVGQVDQKQISAADKAVILTFAERPIPNQRAKVPRGICGKWSVEFSSPDGDGELFITIWEGPANLVKIEVQLLSKAGTQKQESAHDLAATFHELNGVMVAVVEPIESLSSIGLLSAFQIPTFFLCQIKSNNDDTLDICLPKIPWQDGAPSAGTFVRSLNNGRKLLVGNPSDVSGLLNESVKAEWFGESVLSLKKK